MTQPVDWPGLGDEESRAIDPGGDIHATAEYRRHLAGVLAGRAIRLAAARATAAAAGSGDR